MMNGNQNIMSSDFESELEKLQKHRVRIRQN